MSYYGPPYHGHGSSQNAQGYPPHLQPPGYAYVTPPMVVPVPTYPTYPSYPPPAPEPAPTYVTNYIYQQPPEPQPPPVQVVEQAAPPIQDYIDWVPSTPHTAANLSHRAVVAGKEPGLNSSPLWVIRAYHNGDLVPGKLAVNDRRAYIPYCGKEVPVHNFEVLCAPAHAVTWLPSSNGNVPSGAVVGGNTSNGETLYIGRTRHFSISNFGKISLCPGKIHPSHGCLYIPFNYAEVPHRQYDVLCRFGG